MAIRRSVTGWQPSAQGVPSCRRPWAVVRRTCSWTPAGSPAQPTECDGDNPQREQCGEHMGHLKQPVGLAAIRVRRSSSRRPPAARSLAGVGGVEPVVGLNDCPRVVALPRHIGAASRTQVKLLIMLMAPVTTSGGWCTAPTRGPCSTAGDELGDNRSGQRPVVIGLQSTPPSCPRRARSRGQLRSTVG